MTAETRSALVVGGSGPEDLRRTVESLPTARDRTWCAVASTAEAAGVAGNALPVVLDPWPGPEGALDRLYRLVGDRIPDGVVVIVASGTVLRRRFLSRAERALRRAAIVLSSPRKRRRQRSKRAPVGRVSVRMMTEAILRPTSGTALTTRSLSVLARNGWLGDARLRLRDVQDLVGPVRLLPRSIDSMPRSWNAERKRRFTVTVLIPAFNEQGWIGETLRSIELQTRRPDEVIVVDDTSTDRTSDVARHYGARVVRGPGSGSKAGAQNHGLRYVRTDAVVMLDADTLLDREAIDHLVADLEAGDDATTGAVLPQESRGFWARGRLIEYALAVRMYKRIQRFMGSLVVISGCIAAFRTDVLRELGGFQERSITEDLDITWRLHFLGFGVGYTTRALGYPAEPPSWALFKAQMRRWAGGFFQGIALHRRQLHRRPSLGFMVLAAVWDIVSPSLLLVLLVVLAATEGLEVRWDILLMWQGIILGVPFVTAASIVGFRRAAAAIPAYAVVLYLGQYFYFEAFVREFLLRRRRMEWVKGH